MPPPPPPIFAAHRHWCAVSPDGQRHDLHLGVGVPCPVDDHWRADVHLGVLDDTVHRIDGLDAWQALTLGLGFAAMRVAHFIAQGWMFTWADGDAPAVAADLWPGVSGVAPGGPVGPGVGIITGTRPVADGPPDRGPDPAARPDAAPSPHPPPQTTP